MFLIVAKYTVTSNQKRLGCVKIKVADGCF